MVAKLESLVQAIQRGRELWRPHPYRIDMWIWLRPMWLIACRQQRSPHSNHQAPALMCMHVTDLAQKPYPPTVMGPEPPVLGITSNDLDAYTEPSTRTQ